MPNIAAPGRLGDMSAAGASANAFKMERRNALRLLRPTGFPSVLCELTPDTFQVTLAL
jgi:hypothetical protein